MLGETCFSGAALVLLGVVLAPLLTAFGVVYRDGITSRNAQIASLNLRLTEATEGLQRGATVMGEAKSELPPPTRRRSR